MSTLERAIEIAWEAHWGQVDRAGEEYIGHPLRVMEAGRREYPNAYDPWSEADDERLTQLWGEGLALDEIAERFGRKRGAIISRIKKLNL